MQQVYWWAKEGEREYIKGQAVYMVGEEISYSKSKSFIKSERIYSQIIKNEIVEPIGLS